MGGSAIDPWGKEDPLPIQDTLGDTSVFDSSSIIAIKSIGDIVREVDKIVRETKLRWWFRGHADSAWKLLPFVRRGYSRKQEQYLVNEFYVRAGSRYDNCPGQEDYAGWLALMQHYGLPTRLLDWSASPLIAAFFAIQPSNVASDACIWAFAPGRFNKWQGFESLLYPLNAESLRDLLRPAFKGVDETDKIIAAMPIETDARMQVQQGSFTVHASDNSLDEMAGSSSWLYKFAIPAEAKPKVARELELMGFRLGDLFPDLGNLAAELKGRHIPINA
jgi:FRG domain